MKRPELFRFMKRGGSGSQGESGELEGGAKKTGWAVLGVVVLVVCFSFALAAANNNRSEPAMGPEVPGASNQAAAYRLQQRLQRKVTICAAPAGSAAPPDAQSAPSSGGQRSTASTAAQAQWDRMIIRTATLQLTVKTWQLAWIRWTRWLPFTVVTSSRQIATRRVIIQ